MKNLKTKIALTTAFVFGGCSANIPKINISSPTSKPRQTITAPTECKSYTESPKVDYFTEILTELYYPSNKQEGKREILTEMDTNTDCHVTTDEAEKVYLQTFQ